jgi:glycosyltransferase involved in cell wall biosynthesis
LVHIQENEVLAVDHPIRSVTLFFPVYGDEGTVRIVAEQAVGLLSSLGCCYEILIVDDGSPDRSGAIADELSREYECVRVIHHPGNLGYGAAIRSGIAHARYDWICMIDGDHQYDVMDFRKLFRVCHHYDLMITFRYKKIYSSYRILVSWVYNKVLRFLFWTHFRDISSGLRMVRKEVVEDVALESNSPFIGAELAIKAFLKGYQVGEVGIQTFPRTFGRSMSTSPRNIIATIRDMLHIRSKIFSTDYDSPRVNKAD